MKMPSFSCCCSRTGYLSLPFLLPVLLVVALSGSVEAKTLKHRATGFKAKAPSGFKLRTLKGIYTIKKNRDSTTIMKVSSPLSKRETAKSLIKSSRMRKSRIKRGGAVVTGLVRGKPVYIEIKGNGPSYTVSKYVTPKKSGRRAARRTPVLTPRDIAVLRRIARSARGGIISPFQVTVPTKRRAQGGASAIVPDIPGWAFNGAGGAISGGRFGHGFYGLGLYNPGVSNSNDPGQTIINVWPSLFGNNMVIQDIAFVPGTGGVLGPPFNSGNYMVRVQVNGISYDVIMTSGVVNSGGGFNDWYASYIAVRTGFFPGLGQALSRTWSTWDASQSQNQRVAQTIQTIRTTPTVAIDRDAFDRINDAWVKFIRR